MDFDLDDLLNTEEQFASQGYKRAFEGPPEDSGLPKRQQLAQAEDELDDDELLALAFSQPWPPPASSAQPKSQSLPADDTVSKARVANATQGGSPGEGQLNLGPDIDPLGNVMDTAEPGSRPLATTDEVALCLQQLQIQYDPLAIDGPIIQTTAEDGTPAFCLIEEPAEAEPRLPAAKGQLLSRPISQLLAEAEQQSFEKALTESRAMYTQAAKHQQQQRFQQQQQPQHQHEQQTCQELWVDKYRPEGFLELLSNEQVNRNVLDWVKAWDSTVFGFGGAKPARGIGEKPAQTASIDMTVDQKLLLLSGPPGLGKTTLAHTIAKHCGYRAYEINASDDRTGRTLENKISDAVDTQSALGRRLPNLVIIDEVDGVAGGSEGRSAVSTILNLVQSGKDKRRADGDDDAKGAAKSRPRRKVKQLYRPIIAICNDLYATALRPLRIAARSVQLKKPLAARLMARLEGICVQEHIKADRQALLVLTERSDCDMRSCINTLQFLARQTNHIRVSHVRGVQIGQKDATQSAFKLWQRLLCTQGKDAAVVSGRLQDASLLMGVLQDFGDSDLLLAGLHEFMEGSAFTDIAMRRTAEMARHLQDADMFARASMRTGDYGLQKYVPASVLALTTMLAVPHRPRLQWPKVASDHRRQQAAHRELLHGWLLGLAPQVLTSLSIDSAAQEILPALLKQVEPNIRTIAKQLLNATELMLLRTIVSMMTAYRFSFHMGKYGNEGEPEELLEPAIHKLCSFQGLPGAKQLPLTVRQMINHEVQLESFKQQESVPSKSTLKSRPSSASGNHEEHQSQAAAVKLTYSVAERAVAAGITAKRTKRKTTWLDAFTQKKTATKLVKKAQDEAASGAAAQPPVLYKFHEGFTNAVKRPVLMSELM
ncbi:hypothetical protein WJX84_007857 [Apatococcus fuscideae]|uniref:AAA+ ATPase domain-containing protein n=1 Tax=Apatococcus fuscideae TaxID=2026836 RepID=A0AAW1TJA3_9CHLO